MINGYRIPDDANYFIDYGSHSYFLFLKRLKYIEATRMTKNAKIMACKSKFLSDGSIMSLGTTKNSLNSKIDYFNNPKIQVKLSGNSFKVFLLQIR